MINLAKYLLWEFQEESEQKSIKYFRSHGAYGYIIWLTVILEYLKKETISIEALIFASEKYASRRTVVDFISDATIAGHLVKKIQRKIGEKFLLNQVQIQFLIIALGLLNLFLILLNVKSVLIRFVII